MKESLQKAIDNQKETSKLYSEIRNSLRKNNNYESVDGERTFQTSRAAKSIEHLIYDKMEGFSEWIEKNAYCKDGSWYLHENMSGEIYTKKQIVQLYLNK
jgi:hypothetical protein